MQSNPGDYFMKVLTVNYPKTEVDEKHISFLNDHYAKGLLPMIESAKLVEVPELILSQNENKVGGFKQFKLLMWRNRMGLKRNPGHARIKISQTIFMGLLCLALFHDQYGYS